MWMLQQLQIVEETDSFMGQFAQHRQSKVKKKKVNSLRDLSEMWHIP